MKSPSHCRRNPPKRVQGQPPRLSPKRARRSMGMQRGSLKGVTEPIPSGDSTQRLRIKGSTPALNTCSGWFKPTTNYGPNKNPSSSNKTRTADTSVCSGSRAASPSSLDNIVPDRLPFLPPHARPVGRAFPVRLFPLCCAVARRLCRPVPALAHQQPGAQPPPYPDIFSPFRNHGPVGLSHCE